METKESCLETIGFNTSLVCKLPVSVLHRFGMHKKIVCKIISGCVVCKHTTPVCKKLILYLTGQLICKLPVVCKLAATDPKRICATALAIHLNRCSINRYPPAMDQYRFFNSRPLLRNLGARILHTLTNICAKIAQ